MEYPIDIVIPWVDGNDPIHTEKRRKFLTERKEDRFRDVGADTRFSDLGELVYCIDSINIYAPFIRRIFIVTDGQDPGLEGHLTTRFPDGSIPISVVDHKVIFEGYHDYLPVFNSRAIETLIWRIPELSEHFLLMNDDFFLNSPVSPDDFFIDGSPVCYADWYCTTWAKFIRAVKPRKDGRRKVTFKSSQMNAADLIGRRFRFLYLGHTPRPLRKSFYEDFFGKRPDLIHHNIRHRFRDDSQYNSQELFYMSTVGQCRIVPVSKVSAYMNPRKGRRHIERKLKKLESVPGIRFGCINSLDLASGEDRKRILEWLENKFRKA